LAEKRLADQNCPIQNHDSLPHHGDVGNIEGVQRKTRDEKTVRGYVFLVPLTESWNPEAVRAS
jgi:hypothetical protein